MAIFTKISFNYPINSSLQIGDMIYVSSVTDGITSEPVYVEKVKEIGYDYVVVNKDTVALGPVIANGQYILFAKDIRINESSLKGYYANVTFENSSNTKTELFAISSEVALSSK